MEQIRLFLMLLLEICGTLLVVVGPIILIRIARRRNDEKRRALGLPPRKRHTSAVTVGFLLLMLAGGCVMLSSVLNMLAKDKLEAANAYAKWVCGAAVQYTEECDEKGLPAPQTQIGQLPDERNAFGAFLTKSLGGNLSGGWYAVMIEDGEVQLALYSGHELTPADLHKPDADAQHRYLLSPLTSAKDAIGCYTP